MSAGVLSARLARIACDLDELLQAIRAAHLSEGDEELFYPPTAHLVLALDGIEDVVYDLETYGLSPRRSLRLAA